MFCIAAVLSYSDRLVLSLLVDPLRADLHLSDFDVGLLQGVAFSLIYAFAGLALGRAADVLSRKAVVLAGIAIWSVATLSCGYATSFGQLIVGIWILASTSGQMAGLTVLQEVAPNEIRGLSVSIASLLNIGLGLALGAALPTLVAKYLLADTQAVGSAMTLVALPSAIVSILLYRRAMKTLDAAAPP